MARCGPIKPNGERCRGSTTGLHGYCWAHDPANAERRRRMASKAARSKPNRELAHLKAQLEDLTRDVLAGAVETARAAVANQLLNTRLRAVELGRKIRETDELEERLQGLERTLVGAGDEAGGEHLWGV